MVSAVAPSPAMAVATSVERFTSRKHNSDTVSGYMYQVSCSGPGR